MAKLRSNFSLSCFSVKVLLVAHAFRPLPINTSARNWRKSTISSTINSTITPGQEHKFVRIGQQQSIEYISVPGITLNPKPPLGLHRPLPMNAPNWLRSRTEMAPPSELIADIDEILGIKRHEFQHIRNAKERRRTFPSELMTTSIKVKADPSLVGIGAHVARKGLLVERGPDWRWDDQDGGPGSVGIVVGEAGQGWSTVQWPSGYTNGYRTGDNGNYDLRVASSPTRVRVSPDPQHSTKQPSRPGASKLDHVAVGLGPKVARDNLRVERGPHWRWGDQDGGRGSVGFVVGEIRHDRCTVQWPSGHTNVYRIGENGRYEVRIAQREVPASSQSNPHSNTAPLASNLFFSEHVATGKSSISSRGLVLGPKTDPRTVGVGPNEARKGLRVERGPHWQWGDQDGGPGSVGIIVGDIRHGWCTVQWPSGHTNGYRIGEHGHYDLHIANTVSQIPSEAESRGTISTKPPAVRKEEAGQVVNARLVRPGLHVQRGPDWRWGDQDGGLGSIGIVQGVERRGWVDVRWPSGVENGYRVGDGGKFDLQVASRHRRGLHEAHQMQQRVASNKPDCTTRARTRCWCVDQYGDILHLP